MPRDSAERSVGVFLVHSEGKAAVSDVEKGAPGALLGGLLERGRTALAIDPFLTGEFHSPFGRTDREREIRYFTTFNRTDAALRVQDVLTGLAYLRSRSEVAGVHLVGFGVAGLWALLARGLVDGVDRTAVDLAGFNAACDDAWMRDLFVPGLRRVGGPLTAAILTAPAPLLLHNTAGRLDSEGIAHVYRAIGAEGALRIQEGPVGEREVLEWLDSV